MEDMYLYIVNTRDSSACSLITFSYTWAKYNNFKNEGKEDKYRNWIIKTKANIVYLVLNDS